MAGEPTRLTLGHSPDADDMVMFWPLTETPRGAGRRPPVSDERIVFERFAEDVQRLNRRAIEAADLDITAISAHAYPHVKDRYAITSCGGSFGEGYGPKVVVRSGSDVRSLDDLLDRPGLRLLVPGLHTTAYLTLCLLAGRRLEAFERLFSDIPAAIGAGEADAGLLIHEAQIDVDRFDLRAVADLGALWHERHSLPLPLGLNVVRRDLDDRFGGGTAGRVCALLRDSIAHARAHPEASRRFLLEHAGERQEWRDAALVRRYLEMYVSDLTLDMGERGRAALRLLLTEGHELGLCPDPGEVDIVLPAR